MTINRSAVFTHVMTCLLVLSIALTESANAGKKKHRKSQKAPIKLGTSGGNVNDFVPSARAIVLWAPPSWSAVFRVPCLVLTLVVALPLSSLAGNGLVALQTADPACPDNSGNRYVACGNGTVTDNETGLVWLANTDCFGIQEWHDAMEIVAGLADLPDAEVCGAVSADECDCGLSDGSSPGEWRLATVGEWKAMVEHADDVLGCNPTISNDAGDACWNQPCVDASDCSFLGLVSGFFWASSTVVIDPPKAWEVSLSHGGVAGTGKLADLYVWPVRGGQ